MSAEYQKYHRQFGERLPGRLERIRHILLFAVVGKALAMREKLDPAKLFEKGLFVREVRIEGIELIPKEGPLLVVANHDNDDSLRGGIQIAGISFAVWLARREAAKRVDEKSERDTSYIHWIQFSEPKGLSVKQALPLARGGYKLISDCFDTILVERKGEDPKQDAKVKVRRSWESMRQIWEKGGIVGLFPEGDAAPRLQEIDPRTRKLLHVSRRIFDLKVVPVGGWMESYDALIINSGPVLHPKDCQEDMADCAGRAIENLLPPEKRPHVLS